MVVVVVVVSNMFHLFLSNPDKNGGCFIKELTTFRHSKSRNLHL